MKEADLLALLGAVYIAPHLHPVVALTIGIVFTGIAAYTRLKL